MKFIVLLLFSIILNDYIPEPKFGAGYPVEWYDGSKGVVVRRLNYTDDWYYLIRFKYMDWELPEKGLKIGGRSP